MAGGDSKASRALGHVSSRGDIEAEEDPLVELARIVSEDGAFGASKPAKQPPVRPVPPEPSNLADGLEAELLQELETSFARREPPTPVHSQPVEAPAPVAARPAAPSPPPQQDELDPDELLRSIEEQLGQFERRHATRFGGSAEGGNGQASFKATPNEDSTTAVDEPEERVFGAPSAATQSRRASRIRPFAEADEDFDLGEALDSPDPAEPVQPRAGYRFRGPANANWDQAPREEPPVAPTRDEIVAQEEPAGDGDAADLFARLDPVTPLRVADTEEELGREMTASETVELQRRSRRSQPFPEFEEPEPERPEPDLGGIEAELSRELEPDFAEQPRAEAWQDSAPAGESKVASAIVPGPSRRAAAARAAAAQRSRSRVGLVTAAAAVLVIVIAAGAALYLRSSDSASSGPPPVITADAEPVRVEPQANPAAAEGETVGEAVYDRVSGANSQTEEQVVDNTEEPREIARIVLPPSQDSAAATEEPVGGEISSDAATVQPEQPPADAAAAGATEPVAADELGPRLVPTYVVRADGSIVETSAASSPATDPSAAQNQQLVTETEPIEPVPVPTVAIADGGSANDATAAEPSALTPAPADATTLEPAAPAESEDLAPRPSIDDENATVASASPSSEPAAPPAGSEEGNTENSLASAEPAAPPATAASGGYLVQLSAQRSMDEAQSAYAAAQQRYPSVLSSLTAQIQEADLGAKGIFYRVRVGPWENRDDAIGVCEALKAEGGNCFVTQ